MEEQLDLIKTVYVLDIGVPGPREPDLHEEFSDIFDALRQAMMYMKSSDYIVKGIKVIKLKGGQKQVSPHFAKAVCAICKVWIKWLSEADYKYAMSLEPERIDEATEPQETDVERMERCMSDARVICDRASVGIKYGPMNAIALQIAFKLFDGSE